jgi:glycosyltransferase involved in cell wall biosynthesis
MHYPTLATMLRARRPDVIHLWEEPWSLVALQAASLRNRLLPDASLVLEVDQNILKRLPPPFEAVRRHVLRRTDFILARSKDAFEVVKQRSYEGPWSQIGYGVDRSTFRKHDRLRARAQLGLDGFVVGSVGRLIPEKGMDELLEAAALMQQKATIAIMGDGPHHKALSRRAGRLGIVDRVRFFPRAGPERVALFLSAVDVSTLLTRTTNTVREQFGRVITESQACGTPVIGSTCGAIPHTIGDGGWVVPERAPARVASLLDELATAPHRLAEIGARGERQVARRFSYERVAKIVSEAWTEARIRREGQRPREDIAEDNVASRLYLSKGGHPD